MGKGDGRSVRGTAWQKKKRYKLLFEQLLCGIVTSLLHRNGFLSV